MQVPRRIGRNLALYAEIRLHRWTVRSAAGADRGADDIPPVRIVPRMPP